MKFLIIKNPEKKYCLHKKSKKAVFNIDKNENPWVMDAKNPAVVSQE